MNTHTLLFTTLAATVAMTGFAMVRTGAAQPTQKQPDLGIVGRLAPRLDVSSWIQLPEGKETIQAQDIRGKVTYLYFFQSWCPGCHSSGFPTLKKLVGKFAPNNNVQFLAVQTTFEGHDVNSFDKLAETSERYGLKIPFGQSAGSRRTPAIMKNYRTGGTPWVVIIDKSGQVVFNDFHIEVEAASIALNHLSNQPVHQSNETQNGGNEMIQRAVLAGRCFWGLQDLFRKLPSVVSTRVGYSGGDVQNATYRNHGSHAEAIGVVYDPDKTNFRNLLEFFFQVHDPTTANR